MAHIQAHTHESGIIVTHSAVFRYGVAVVAVAAAAAVRLALEAALGSPYVPLTLAVIVASRFGGRGPGLAATVLCVAVVDYFFLGPPYGFGVPEPYALPGLALFAVVGTIISFLIGQLRQKSARLEELNTALEMAHAMVRTPDGVITHWSRSAETMYGWPPEDAIGRRLHDLLKTEFPEPLEKIQERLTERGDWDGELRHHRRDGSTVVAASHWSLQRDQRGRPSAVIEVNNDITALRQAEEAARETEAQFRTLADAIPQLCWMANAEGWTFWYNQRWYAYTGTTPEQMEGWGWQSVHDPEVLPEVMERWKASLATGEPFDMTFPLRGADGVFRPFLTRVMPVRGRDGKVVRWFGTNTDISEQWKTEQALRASEERLAYDLDAMTRLQKVGTLFVGERDMERVLGEILDAAIAISGADFGTIQFLDPLSSKLKIVAQRGFPRWWIDFFNEVSEGQGSCGTSIERGERVIVEDVEQSPIFAGTPALEIQLKAGVRAVQFTPLIRRSGTALGMFSTHYRKPQRPDDHALKLLDLLARQAADIIERAQTEQALRESEERLRLAQQVARVGTFEWNIQTGVNRWTPELEAMYGLPPGGFAGTRRAWEELVHPGDRAEVARRVERALDTGGFEAEWRVIHPSGELRWLFGRGWVFKDDSGKPLRLIGVNIDITERKRAEEALQQKTELVNFSHDAIIVADANRVITSWNTGAEEIYGWTRDEAVGKVTHQFLQTESPISVTDSDRILARDGRWDAELVHTRRDGKQIIVESRQVLRRDAAGVPIAILEINRDISERKRLEDQFRQAQKLEGIGRLAGGVAHDFNNLLTVISGYAQTVLDDLGVQHPLREPMEQISQAAARATRLTRQLLIFSRRQVSEPRNILLNDLVRDFEKMLRRLIGEDINLVLALDPAAGVIRADAGQIEQVILNLAVNARDAMPKGGTLSIRTSRLLADDEFVQKHLGVQPGLYVVLVVSDTGVGMSAEVKSHLFEPFFTTKETGRGTGLGLSTVYGIVKQSEGSVWVYSEAGQGTTFKILFPAVGAEGKPASAAPVKAPSGNETILLVEDEPAVRGFARLTLERHGYTVLEAANGRQALELARQHTGPIHLVLADVVMPEMGGPELAKQFGARHPSVPVLFMSGYPNHSGQQEGPAAYLQKPFTSATLLTQVRAALDAV